MGTADGCFRCSSGDAFFSDSLELWRLGSRRFIRRSVEILPCKRSERFALTFFQKPLDNLFGLCYNTSCSVERSTDGNAALAQLDRVTGYEPVGRGFESLPSHQEPVAFRMLQVLFLHSGPKRHRRRLRRARLGKANVPLSPVRCNVFRA